MRWLALGCFVLGFAASGCTTDAFCFVCHHEKDAGLPPPETDATTIIIQPPPPMDSGMHMQQADTGPKLTCDADLTTDPNNCGACGNVCTYPGAYGKCVDGDCQFDRCADGMVDVNKDPKDGCECTVTNGGTEACDGIDNNCDGQIDEGFDLQTDVNNCGACNTACPTLPHSTLSCVTGACHYDCDGGYSNLGQMGVGCPYQCPVSPPVPETCNGVDDDCDGIIDNGNPGAGVPCDDNCPNGKCVGACTSGTTVCTGTAEGIACVGGTRPTGEICDGIDNDCDGVVDNGFDLQNDALNCGMCGRQCKLGSNCVMGSCDFKCAPNQRDLDGNPSNGCEYTCPVFPIQPEVCDGIDQDCDGVVDNNPTDVGQACTGNCPAPDPCVAAGTCSPYKTSTANGSCYGVCSANGVTACVAGVKSCTYSTQRLDELCNNLDDNCDGRIDEGFDLQNDPANCGACGQACSEANSLAVSCVKGACASVTACQPGYKDLNGQVADGCEYKCPVWPPVGELCNGIDDNCDGIIDNSPSGSGQACTADCPKPDPCIAAGNCTLQVSANTSGCYGACAFDGRTACASGSDNCSHPGKTAETCNGLDDDCDGLIDNGFNLLTDVNNCGSCGFKCALPGTTNASCVNGQCRSTKCTPGFIDLDNDPTNGCEYACPVFPTKPEVCNGIDDDCDGVKDDSPTDTGKACTGNCPAPDPCVAANSCSPATIAPNNNGCYGVCQPGGLTVCTNGALTCSYASLEQPETCNGVDDNCDGRVDEGFNKQTDPNNCGACGKVCTATNASAVACTSGACGNVTACATGYKDLDGKPANGCEYKCPVYPPVGESCNGKDDDCNGVIDDNITGLGAACTSNCPAADPCVAAGNCTTAVSSQTNGCYGVCATDGRTTCTSGATVCNHVAAKAETCNGVDDNCDGRIDEGFNTKTDVNNCGGCGVVCALPGATAACVGGLCVVNNCTAGRADVDKNPANGCEYVCPVYPPKAETCNGVDDDCNGVIDDNPTDVGGACSDNCPGGVCKGICTQGSTVCISGKKVCQGGGGAQLEVCNGKDDDCDGIVDNGFNKQTDPLNCGTCGNACNLPNTSVNTCTAGICTVGQCDPGFNDVDGNAANGCEYACPVYPTRSEICNGVDDNCDNKVDTADPTLVTPANFCVQTGPCSGSKPVCNAFGNPPVTSWHCNYGADVEVTATDTVALTESKCDGKDGNCNGQVDESFPLKGQPCSVGKGICAGNSTYACTTDMTSVQCPATATPSKAVDEDCNGLDDNCDGNVDERTPTIPAGGLICTNGGNHTCLGWVDPMVKVGTAVWIYDYEASRPDATSTSGGTKTTRACSKGSRIPWSSVNASDAAAACAAVKDSAGNPMRLCTQAEWQTACDDNNTANLWSYASAAGTYVAGRCNDNASVNPGAPWATGSGANCYANWTGLNRLYDMSGNVSEWTSTTATSNGNTYQRVLGGNYQTFPNGTRCDFAFVLQQPTFQNFDLGFRCCSNAAP
ncbi:MAG TPA: MopE-related protein [Polyangiaceae bacterium]|nr:MopE-related protein [Polyangiaceae bacterium]